jgi:hypothetical protein
VGDNPVGDFLTDITDELDDVITDIDNDKSTWENIGGTCTQEMNGLVTTLDSMNTNVASLLSQFDCTPINNAWAKIVNSGLCGDFYSGFYQLWVVLVLCAFLLFFLLIFAALLFKQYEQQVVDHEPAQSDELGYGDMQMQEYHDGNVSHPDAQKREAFDEVVVGRAV